jgi:glycosyltransferase involved in cell wall biosynthesis
VDGPASAPGRSRRGPTTVLHLSSSSGPGGAEAVVANVASGLDASRYRSVVCLFRDGWLRQRCEQLGLETHVVRMSGMLDLQWLQQCHRLLRTRDVGVIHAHEFGANAYGTLVGRLARVPVVATVHGRSYYADCGRRRLAYRVVSRAATMVAVSADIKRFIVERTGVSAARVHIVHNGIDVPRPVPAAERERLRTALGIRPGAPLVTVVGSLYDVKGHRYLLEAAPAVLAACPDTVFLIVGRGEREAALREQAQRLGLEAAVRFLGFREDVPALLAISDLFVLPSLSEGLSIAVLEAMAAGKPVVTTRVGGNPELVLDGQTGLLVESADARGLAAAMTRILTDPREARRLGDNGRCRVADRFTMAAMIRAYQDLYDAAGGLAALPDASPGSAMASRWVG